MSAQPDFTSTVTQRISFRAGHVVANLHVHDFTVTVTASGPVTTTPGPTEGMGVDILALRRIITDEVAVVLGHRMSVWTHEPQEVLDRPCDWPKDITGPEMPELLWPVRPTVENLGRWVAARVVAAAHSLAPDATITRVEVAETPRTSVIFTDTDLALLPRTDVPGPDAEAA